MPRIASLLPSATEIVCALGAFDLLCAVSHECDYPPQVARAVREGRLPVVTSARLGPPGPLGPPPGSLSPEAGAADSGAGAGAASGGLSRWIDESLRELVRQALAVYTVDEAALATAQPDIVLTQDLCEVCAVSYTETCRAVNAIAGREVTVLNTHPANLAGIWADIQCIGTAIGREAEAELLLKELLRRVEHVRLRAEKAVSRWRGGMAPRVVSLEWLDPPLPGGLWMPELIHLGGGWSRVRPGQQPHGRLSEDELLRLNPEVLILHPCGMTLEQSIPELPALRAAVPWDAWACCMGGQVYLLDGSAYFNRPGPRIVDSLELLASCIQPGEFHPFRRQYCDAGVTVGPNLEIEEW